LSYASDSITSHRRNGTAFQLARFAAALAWSISSKVLSDSSARGLTLRFHLGAFRPLLAELFLLFLLVVGFSLLDMIARRQTPVRSILALPKRPTQGGEWMIGAALGWGMVILAILPLALTGGLDISFWHDAGTPGILVVDLFTLFIAALTTELIFRGYPFRCLIEAIGPVAATLVMSVLFGLLEAFINGGSSTGVVIAMMMGLVFSIAWLRTHGLWLAWGMRFAWITSMGVLFGLPVNGSMRSAVFIQASTSGPNWLTGGDYGPEGTWPTALALLIGLIVLIRVTRDYAWNYTHPPVVPGGYPMEAQPPAAHIAMEQAQQNRAPALVQILPSSPQGRSVGDPPES
jgi:membrane protease YdiL (CAAX protease family)